MAQNNILDSFIEKTVEQTGIDKNIIEKVISSQWEGAYRALQQFKEVEISGLGRFFTRDKKILERQKLLKDYIWSYNRQLEREENPKKRETIQKRLDSATSEYEYLNTKLNEQTSTDLVK